MKWIVFFWIATNVLLYSVRIHGSQTDERLVKKIFHGYNKYIRPAQNFGEPTNVTFYLTLLQLISVTEKTEQMTSSLYTTLQWEDPRLTWNPEDFEGITLIRIPSQLIWKPDLALHNNNDGKYDTTVPVNALLNNTGFVEWLPAAFYKSSCKIKVDLFPFDWQNCTMKFKSFAYQKDELTLRSAYDKVVVDNEAYRDNGEWNIVHCPIKTNEDPRDPLYQDITLYFIIQRRSLFYVLNIIVPCVLISSLSVLVFLLPSASSEKMTMGISVLLGLTVYLLLLAKRIPETSLGVPLIGIYLLFTMLTVTVSIFFSVVVLNCHHQRLSTLSSPGRCYFLFMKFLPHLLGMQQPTSGRRKLLRTYDERVKKSIPVLYRMENTSENSELVDDAKERKLDLSDCSGSLKSENIKSSPIHEICSSSQTLHSIDVTVSGSSLNSASLRNRCILIRHKSSQNSKDEILKQSCSGEEVSRENHRSSRVVFQKKKSMDNLIPNDSAISINTFSTSCSGTDCVLEPKDNTLYAEKINTSIVSNQSGKKGVNFLTKLTNDIQGHKKIKINRKYSSKASLCKSDTRPLNTPTKCMSTLQLPSMNENQKHLCKDCERYSSDSNDAAEKTQSGTKQLSGSELHTAKLHGNQIYFQTKAISFSHELSLNNPNEISTKVCQRKKNNLQHSKSSDQIETTPPTNAQNSEEESPNKILSSHERENYSDKLGFACEAVNFISERMRSMDKVVLRREDWHFVANVLDRLLLIIFFCIFLLGIISFTLMVSDFDYAKRQM